MESVFIVSPLPTASIFFWLGDVCLLVVPSQKVYEKKHMEYVAISTNFLLLYTLMTI